MVALSDGSIIAAAEEPYGKSGWTALDYAMWVFRRLSYGFAQAQDRSLESCGLLRLRYARHVQH